MILGRDQILNVKDIKTETIHVPEWDGDVKVKMLSGTEREEFESSLFDEKTGSVKTNMRNLRSRLISLCVVDDAGTRIFSDKDIEILSQKSARALDRVFKIAQSLNAIGQKEMEDLTKN